VQRRTNRSRAGAGAEENSRAGSSGKKRGAAIIVGEEEGRGHRHRGRRGARPSLSGKKRGTAIVIGEEEGRGRRRRGRRGAAALGRRRAAAVIIGEEGLGAALLGFWPGKKKCTRVGEKGGRGKPFYPKSWLCVAHPSEVRYGYVMRGAPYRGAPRMSLYSSKCTEVPSRQQPRHSLVVLAARWLFGRCQVRTLDLPPFFVFTETVFQKV
jgi:hypothetical protein